MESAGKVHSFYVYHGHGVRYITLRTERRLPSRATVNLSKPPPERSPALGPVGLVVGDHLVRAMVKRITRKELENLGVAAGEQKAELWRKLHLGDIERAIAN